MIYSYGFSLAGSSHLKSGIPCQDANKAVKLGKDIIIAAIADGVGSCQYADVASSIAVDVSVRVCSDEIKTHNNCDLLNVIAKAFIQAEKEIYERSLAENHLITDYDTTLSLAIYDGKHLTYGHCGDGGIIGLTTDGDYIKVTSPQKLEDTYVIPLRDGKNTWIIGESEEEFASVLLTTDGAYDVMFPNLLKEQPVEMYIPFIRYFIDNNLLQASRKNIRTINTERKAYLNGNACVAITDDKAIRVLINGDIKPKVKDDEYYAEPDWNMLQLEWDKKAYPHLYAQNDDACAGPGITTATDESAETHTQDN